jgi:hypothetical protein
MDPLLEATLSTSRALTLSLHLPRLLRAAAVPLTFGLLCVTVSAVGYAWQLADQHLGSYFSSAAQVGVGVLVALIVEGAVRGTDDDPLVRGLRAGTLALTAAGTAASLIGLVVSGAVAGGVMFGLAWGGLAAGVVGLLVFAGDPETTRRVAAAAADATEDIPVQAADSIGQGPPRDDP